MATVTLDEFERSEERMRHSLDTFVDAFLATSIVAVRPQLIFSMSRHKHMG